MTPTCGGAGSRCATSSCSGCATPARCRSTSIHRSSATTILPRASPSRAGAKRFSTEYWAARNRIGVLVETHSWKDYPTRVRITRNSIIAMMEMAARDGRKWLQAAKTADEHSARVGGTNVALTYENTPHVRTIEFRGYEYTREPSAISGALLTRYNPKKPQIWRIPLFDEVRPAATVTAPRGGYIVPAAYAQIVGEKLALHGIEFRKLRARAAVDAEVFRATKVTYSPRPSKATRR